MERSMHLACLSIAALISLSACSSSPAPGEGNVESARSSEQSATVMAADYNDADVMFAQMMIPHHQQAVDMGETILAKDGTDPQVVSLATSIVDSQAPEIEIMTSWLVAWDGSISGEGMGGHDMSSMDGMLSVDQMAALESAEGDGASRLFLKSMTAHHEGAVTMAQDEIDEGRNREAIGLASDIIKTQESEIDQMQSLMDTL